MDDDIYDGHAESCHALSPGDRECNCHKIQGFNSAEEMEDAERIAKAVTTLNAVHDQRFAPYRGQWQTIRAHLMSQEAEVKRLNAWIAEYCKANRKAFLADQYRLAAANALLREIGKMADGTLCDEVRDYLQGAGDEA